MRRKERLSAPEKSRSIYCALALGSRSGVCAANDAESPDQISIPWRRRINKEFR